MRDILIVNRENGVVEYFNLRQVQHVYEDDNVISFSFFGDDWKGYNRADIGDKAFEAIKKDLHYLLKECD